MRITYAPVRTSANSSTYSIAEQRNRVQVRTFLPGLSRVDAQKLAEELNHAHALGRQLERQDAKVAN
jgi:hypothetical protein